MENKKMFHILNNSKFLLFLSLFIILFSFTFSENSSPSICEELIHKYRNNEEELNTNISKSMFEIKSDNKCLENLVSKGLYKSADYLIQELSKRQIKYKDQIKSANSNASKKLKEIYNNFRFEEKDYIAASPAFQWAQSGDNVFIEIKYAHRFDAPGCLDVKKEKVDVEGNVLNFTAYCIQGDTPIKFSLSLDLFEEVNQELSTFTSNSVGRYQVTLRKRESSYWKSLLKKQAESPSNMRMWLEMREKYLEEIQKYIDETEEEENKGVDDEIKEIRNRKKDKTKLDGDL